MVPFHQSAVTFLAADIYSHPAVLSYIDRWQRHMLANTKLQLYKEITYLECRQKHETFIIVCSRWIEVIYLVYVSIA